MTTPIPGSDGALGRPDGFEALVDAIRGATRQPMDWALLADDVAAAMRGALPSTADILGRVPSAAHAGADVSQPVHVEPDGSFSIVAMITRPGQRTPIHDHTTWCAVAVIAGVEQEERFEPDGDGICLPSGRPRTDGPGVVSAFAPPGDIHRVTNIGDGVGVSLNVYGTDVSRIGNSVRRTYRLAASVDGLEVRA